MKIYYDSQAIKNKYEKQIKNTFPGIDFVHDISHDYDAEAIISMPEFLKPENLDLFTELKWVHVLTAGFDNLDLDYYKNRGVMLTNAKDVFSIQIAEDIFSKILYFNRNLNKHVNHMTNHLWKYEPVHYEIANSTVGIIGSGSIGLEMAKRMKAFDAKVIGFRRTNQSLPYFDEIYTNQEGLNKLYKESDYIVVSLPLSKGTYHMIDEKAFALMKRNSMIINVARGDIIDQKALVKALKTKQIRAAGLDVMSPEPLPSDHELWSLDNVFITPHNASSSPFVNHRLINKAIETIKRYITNQDFDNRIA